MHAYSRNAKRRHHHGSTPPAHPSPAALLAFAEAAARAEYCHDTGHLLNPEEAMAIALHDSRDLETLYSIACHCAWRHGADVDDVLGLLTEKFPDYS